MYSAAVVDDRLQTLLKSPLGKAVDGRVDRVDVATCQHMARTLAGLLDPKKGLTRPLTADEQWFVRNERFLTKVDYRYAAERYHQIIRPDVGVSPMYPLWESQTLILQALADEEEKRYRSGHPDGLVFNILKGRQLGACVDGSTRVLTADLQWVRADTIPVGVELIAVDEDRPGGRGASRKMRTTVVEAKAEVFEVAFEVLLRSGASVVCSGAHRWLYRTGTQTDCNWRMVADMKVGGALRRITEPWGASSLEDYWMGGMLDGEGSCNAKSAGGVELSVCQVRGPVFDRLGRYFVDRAYHTQANIDNKPIRPSKFGRRPVDGFSVCRMSELFRLLGQTRPTRFIGRRWWEGKELPGKRTGGYGWDTIVGIRSLGRRRLVDLQTSTKTFIAEGLVSHNSTLCQSAIAHRVTTQSYTKSMVASDVPENSGSTGLFGMLELTVEHLPWWLRPREKGHVKNQHILFDNHSSVVVEAGKSMKGGLTDEGGQKGQLGRSKTYSCVHLSELSTWEYADTIDDSLDPAIARTPRTFWAKESTAKGRHNWWHKEWEATEAGYGRSFNIFIPWYAERTKYWLPVPTEGWDPPGYCLEYAERVTRAAPRWMRRSFSLSTEQLYWYYRQREAAEQKDALYKFLEEYPAEPAEAFQYSGRSIFKPAEIDRLRNAARPLQVLYRVQPSSLITEMRDQAFQEHHLAKEEAAARRGPILVQKLTNDPSTQPTLGKDVPIPEEPSEVLS